MKRILRAAILVIGLAALIVSCSPPSANQNNPIVSQAARIPDGNYFFLVGADFSALMEAPLFNRLKEEAFAEDWQDAIAKAKEMFGAEPKDINGFIFTMQMPQIFSQTMPEMLTLVDGKFQVDKEGMEAAILSGMPEGATVELETKSHKDKEYWVQNTPMGNNATMVMDSGLAAGEEESLISYIDFVGGEGKALVDKESVKEALSHVHPDSQVSLVVWDIASTLGPMAQMAASMAQKPEEKEALSQLGNLESVVGSVQLTDGMYLEGILLFSTDDAAASFETFIREQIAKVPETMDPEEGSMMITPPSLNKESLKKITETIEISRNGKTLKISNTIPADSPVWEEIIAKAKERKQQLEELEEGMIESEETPDAEM